MSALLATVLAQPTAVPTLERALASGRVHHAYLFDGPEGVGKERAAFGLAQALVCERRAPDGASACGACSACQRTVLREGERRPRHPDVVVLERGLYEAAAIGRKNDETQDLSIDQVRTLVLARASFAPHEGRAKVFIVRRAEEMSIGAANALLKTLEEPSDRTHFVLLSSTPDALLPTIRSRALRVRFGRLPDAVVAHLLSARGTPKDEAEAIAKLAGGSMATATALSDPDASTQRAEFLARAKAALDADEAGAALDLAAEAKQGDRDALIARVGLLALALGDEAKAAAGAPTRDADQAAIRYGLALAAIRQLEGNASPQLTMEAMLLRMRSA